MNLRKRLHAADPLQGRLGPELPAPPLPAGEVREIAYTGARRRVLPRRVAAVAAAVAAASGIGFVAANLIGTSSTEPSGQPAGGSSPPATAAPSTTTEAPPVAATAAPPGGREETVAVAYPHEPAVGLTYLVPPEWRDADPGDAAAAYRAGSCGAEIVLRTYNVEIADGRTAQDVVREMSLGNEVLASTSGGRMAFRLVRDDENQRLRGAELLPVGPGRWVHLDVTVTGACEPAELARRFQEPVTNLLAYLRPE